MNVQLKPCEFECFQQLLVEQSGIHFDAQRCGLLQSALAERMRERRAENPWDYYGLLKCHSGGRAELAALIDLITVGETYFFRNQAQFDVLRDRLLPQLLQQRQFGARCITIWSAACSTGEEPYSIALTLLEAIPDLPSWNVLLLATDVNRKHLLRAREAVYGERAVQKVPPKLLEKYFTVHAGRYALSEQVKQLVRFEHHNLVTDPYTLPGMQQVDFLFCRNVTIYFPFPVTKGIMDRFASAITSDGHLFLGDAETLWQISEKFVPVQFPHTFVYRRPTGERSVGLKPLPCVPEPQVSFREGEALAEPSFPHRREHRPCNIRTTPEPTASVRSAGPKPDCAPGFDALRAKDHGRALTHFKDVLQENPDNAQAHFGMASVHADRDQPEQAIAELQKAIASDNLACEAYYLLGAVYAKTGAWQEAVHSFQRAVYVDPSLALAHVALGNIFKSQGRSEKARKCFQHALRVIDDRPDDELVQFSEDISCGYLRAVCARHLEQLEPHPSTRNESKTGSVPVGG